jgi:hypothetical protein
MSSCIYNINLLCFYKGFLKFYRPGGALDFVAGVRRYTKIQHISNDVSHKRAILNFVKGAAKNLFLDIQLNDYCLLDDFMKGYNKRIIITCQNFRHYKHRPTKFQMFRLNHQVSSFIEYVKLHYPHFDGAWLNPEKSTHNVKEDAHSDKKSTSEALKHNRQHSKRHLSILAYTDKRCYTTSHATIIKLHSGCRYNSTHTYAEIRRLKDADLVFDRSDHFLNTLDKKHELVPILMPDLSKYKLEKDKRKKIRREVYGLHG